MEEMSFRVNITWPGDIGVCLWFKKIKRLHYTVVYIYASLEGSSVYKLSRLTVWGAGGSITMDCYTDLYIIESTSIPIILYTNTVIRCISICVYNISTSICISCFDPHQRQNFRKKNSIRFRLVPGCMSYNVHDRSWEKPLYSFWATLQKQPPRGFCFRKIYTTRKVLVYTSHLVG